MKKETRLHSPGEGKPKNSTQMISMFVGCVLTVLSLAGMLFSAFLGLHLGPLYSVSIFVAGVLLIYNGYKNNSRDAFLTTFFFSLFFGLQALAGWIFGQPGLPGVGYDAPDSHLLRIIPRFHELGRHDHILNTILAFVLAGGAFDWWRRQTARRSVMRVLRDYFDERRHSHHPRKPIRH